MKSSHRLDRSLAIASMRRLAQLSQVEAVLGGDGWQISCNREAN